MNPVKLTEAERKAEIVQANLRLQRMQLSERVSQKIAMIAEDVKMFHDTYPDEKGRDAGLIMNTVQYNVSILEREMEYYKNLPTRFKLLIHPGVEVNKIDDWLDTLNKLHNAVSQNLMNLRHAKLFPLATEQPTQYRYATVAIVVPDGPPSSVIVTNDTVDHSGKIVQQLNAIGIEWRHEYYWPGDYYYINIRYTEDDDSLTKLSTSDLAIAEFYQKDEHYIGVCGKTLGDVFKPRKLPSGLGLN